MTDEELDRQPTIEPTFGPDRTGALVAAVVGGLVLVALVVIVFMREPVQLGLDTPEGTVQAWLQALADGDDRGDLVALDEACDDLGGIGPEVGEGVRAAVLDSRVDGDRATVDLTITEDFGGGLFDDGYTHEERYELRRDRDGWVITGFEWPYHRCAGLGG